MWALRGSRPQAPRQTEYGYTYVFAAVCPATGDSVALVLPWANTEMMTWFLAELALAVPAGAHLVLVLDNAGWHRSHDLIVPGCISLLFLPPYSPELNPVERVWGHLKKRRLSNRVLVDEEAVVEACAEGWSGLGAERLKSLCGGGPDILGTD